MLIQCNYIQNKFMSIQFNYIHVLPFFISLGTFEASVVHFELRSPWLYLPKLQDKVRWAHLTLSCNLGRYNQGLLSSKCTTDASNVPSEIKKGNT